MFLAVKSNRHVSGHMEIKGQNVVESRPHSTFYKSRKSSIQKEMANPVPVFDRAPFSRVSRGLSRGCVPPHVEAHVGSFGATPACFIMPSGISSLYFILIQLLERT